MSNLQTYEAWKQAIIDYIKSKGKVIDPVINDSSEYRDAYVHNIHPQVMYDHYIILKPHFDTCEQRFKCVYPTEMNYPNC